MSLFSYASPPTGTPVSAEVAPSRVVVLEEPDVVRFLGTVGRCSGVTSQSAEEGLRSGGLGGSGRCADGTAAGHDDESAKSIASGFGSSLSS
mmetsp:Transcript_84187/g.234768  ORF Transcript_84187/g.234768 Transcript_84187/m.234768 type:complete len:92 (+) Transcript_84187:429-704(+)